MNVVIIEDEIPTALDLRQSIQAIRPQFEVAAILDSVESALEWFSEHPAPDLIFSDIQLGDGMAFDIFKKMEIPCPVIFCTAFDEYAIEAFKANGIDYLLKPITEKDLVKSLEKIELLKGRPSNEAGKGPFQSILHELEVRYKDYKSTFLIPYRDRLVPLNISVIYLFSLKEDLVSICTNEGQLYYINKPLDALESQIDPKLFYRANRQNLIAFQAITEVQYIEGRKLQVNHKVKKHQPLIISKQKAPGFLKWMEDR